jgi:hypothetical protein
VVAGSESAEGAEQFLRAVLHVYERRHDAKQGVDEALEKARIHGARSGR